jgi:hypothetical protein
MAGGGFREFLRPDMSLDAQITRAMKTYRGLPGDRPRLVQQLPLSGVGEIESNAPITLGTMPYGHAARPPDIHLHSLEGYAAGGLHDEAGRVHRAARVGDEPAEL